MYKENDYLILKLAFWLILFIPNYYAVQAMVSIVYSNKLRAEGVRLEAKVISVRERYENDDDGQLYYYSPTVNFKTYDSISHTKELPEGIIPYTEGETIELIYLPFDFEKIKQNHYYFLYSKPVTQLIVTILLSGIIVGILYFFVRKALLA